MKITDLPDLCSLRILSYLPPRDLLGQIPLVCRSWHRLAQEACRRTHSIALIVDNEERALFLINEYTVSHRLGTTPGVRVNRIRDEAFRKLRLNLQFCELLVETFPNIESLEILIGFQLSEPAALQSLLDGWASRLARLGIWFPRPAESWLETFLADFLNSLDRLTALRVLTIYIRGAKMNLAHFELRIMEQLEQLDLTLPCTDDRFIQALIDQELDTGPDRITLTNPFDIVLAVDLLTHSGLREQIPLFARKFLHLHVGLWNIFSAQYLGAHFSHLQSLELRCNQSMARIQDLSGPLSQLTQLNTLELIYSIESPLIRDFPEFFEIHDNIPVNAPGTWYPLPSVRIFMLVPTSGFTTHNWLARDLNPSVLLPGLEYVYVCGENMISLCEVCSHGRPKKEEDVWTYDREPRNNLTTTECLKNILEPFNGCPELRYRFLTSTRLPNNIQLNDGWEWKEGKTQHPW